MTRIIAPIIILFLIIALFWGGISPLIYNTADASRPGILAQRAERDSLNQALERADALTALEEKLNERFGALTPQDLAKLDSFLPDSLDPIEVVVDVATIAKQNGLSVKNIKVETPVITRTTNTAVSTSTIVIGSLGTESFSATVSGNYTQFQRFISDLAKSLRVIDLTALSFTSVDDKDTYQYTINFKTYWLKN
ncbi:MAG: type 4a pilus biogenesis protein PilO [Candidatus Vogelbacteria bacterium]|nr:type 4a pilus biogenesis protein PilO [Candidatus Vogelbacteria bacterium]